jgi:hypothetical protein
LGGFLAFVLLLSGVDGLVFGYIVMYIAGFAMLAILTYKQTRRLSLHAARESLVREGMLDRLRSLNESNASAEVKSEIAALEGLHAEASKQESLPNQTYAAMSALPLVGPVIAYYYLFRLERLTRGHDERWRRMVQGYASAMKSVGRPAPNVPGPTLAERNFVLYLVISLAFFPFLAYWYHVLVREANEHFRVQWKAEDELQGLF